MMNHSKPNMILTSKRRLLSSCAASSSSSSSRILFAVAILLLSSFIISQPELSNAQDFEDVTLNQPTEVDPQKEALKRPERVTVVAPKYLRPQSDYHVLVNLANSEVPVSIDLQLTGARDSNHEQSEAKSVLAQAGETQTIKFNIGDWPPAEYILNVTAQAIDRSWNWTQEAQLTYQAKSFSGFIQTDKAIYKPGQLVQFRALFMNQALAPVNLNNEINVTVSDPKRNLIKQWQGLSNYRGLLSLDLQLSEDPMLGDYTIRVEAKKQEFSKQFKVAEYILPTFDVSIRLPAYATYNESDIVATVKAAYTYGKPVSGHVALTVQPLVRFHRIDTRPLHQAQYRARLVNGSADISLDVVRDLKQQRDLFEREIEFFALVEEDLTGRKYNKTAIMKVHDKNVKIETVNQRGMPESFKPGLKYSLQLKVAYQDDSPVEDNGPELELRYGFSGSAGQMNSAKLRSVGGIVEHSIRIPAKIESPATPDRLISPTELDLQVVYRGQVHYLNPILAYSSESQQYMQISLPQLETRARRRNRPQAAAASTLNRLTVNDDLKVKVEATEGMQQITCQGLARGDIIWALSADAKNKSEFEFDIKIDQRMAPEARILCFYIRPENKELIADSMKVNVNGLAKNSIKITTSRDEAKPGQEVEVGVFTKPNSLVGLLGIDQSVLLLKSGNDIQQSDLDAEMKSYGSSTSEGGGIIGPDDRIIPFVGGGGGGGLVRNTEALFDNAEVVILTNNLVYRGFGFREGRLLYMNNIAGRPSNFAFRSQNIALDSIVLNKEITPPEFHINKPKSDPPVIRSFFPETWFWENSTAGSDGIAKFKAKVPDTITSWVLSAFSINENFGLGLSTGKTSVRVFRPFFIKLNLPYSIIRGETISIQAVIFNYSKRPTSAKVTLENKLGEFDFVEAANNIEDEKMIRESSESRTLKIPAEDGAAVSFLIRPRKLGSIEIKMIAQSEFAADGVVRKLLVKPEGQTQFFNKAMLINLPGPQSIVKRNVSLEVPANAVVDSQKVFVSAVGDIMGAGLSNVDDLLRLPYGCGEQNMINLVPNIVILNYLQNSKRLRETQRVRAVRNIETGYQRQLNYKRNDGSFSAFGNMDANGSVWLTAYVLKTLQQAKSIITVDDKVIRRAANFIARFSKPDGSIEEVGMVHHKELQSSSSSSNYLTAYSAIALLQQPIGADSESPAPVALDEVLDRALNFLEGQLEAAGSNESPYELAIIAYTLSLASANRRESLDRAYEKLWSRAQEDGDFVWWSGPNSTTTTTLSESGNQTARLTNNSAEVGEREFETLGSSRTATTTTTTAPSSVPPTLKPRPVNTKQSAHLYLPDSLAIEMSSFALLTTVKQGELERALPIVRWLIAQQNSNGGFVSTQDTVLAVEALATYAAAAANSKAPLSIDIEYLYPRVARQRSEIRRTSVDEVLISNTNALVNQQTRLPDNVTWVQIQATGAGSAVVQVSWQYNLLVSAERPAFYLNPILDKTSNVNYLQLSICTYYKAGDSSNMAVMEVELPSGYVADVESLPGLTLTKDVKRVDTADGDTKVIIYLDKVTRDEVCLTVTAHRTAKVSNQKPVPVSIYDYYNRQQAARIFYEPQPASSCDICDPDQCNGSCSSKPKRSDRLVSLHEQRRINPTLQRAANLTVSPPSQPTSPTQRTSNGGDTSGYPILPLAPVLMALITAVQGLYQQQP